MKGEDLRFVIDGHTYHFNEGDIWSVNRRHIHSSTGEQKDWHYFGMIIDDDFLLSQFPSSKDWNLNLLGKSKAKNEKAYQEIIHEMLTLHSLMQKKITDQNRFFWS